MDLVSRTCLSLGIWILPARAQCIHFLSFCHLPWSLKVRVALLVAKKLLKCDFISGCVTEGPKGPDDSSIYCSPIWFCLWPYIDLWNEYSLQSPHDPIPSTDQNSILWRLYGRVKYFFHYPFLISPLAPTYFKEKLNSSQEYTYTHLASTVLCDNF